MMSIIFLTISLSLLQSLIKKSLKGKNYFSGAKVNQMKHNESEMGLTKYSSSKLDNFNNFESFGSMNEFPIIRNHTRKCAFKAQQKKLKQQTRESFEKQLDEIPSQFNVFIKKEYDKMLRQKSQNPTLMIPSGFQKFIHSKLFLNLLQKIYEYMQTLIEYNKKFQHIKDLTQKFEYTERYEPGLKKLRYETNHLQQKCKQISYVYMGILLSHGESKMMFKDQYFFQTMIYFISQILKSIFEEDDHPLIEQELNRFFRTNAFNLIKRRNEEDKTYRKYPSLKETKYDQSANGVRRIIKRLSIQKRFNYSIQLKPENTERLRKPLEIQLTALGSMRSRSPLISSFYPSSKQKLYEFSKGARDKESFIRQNRASNSLFLRK